MNDEKLLDAIKKIIRRGNNAEIRKKSDGTLVVFEIKRNIVAQ